MLIFHLIPYQFHSLRNILQTWFPSLCCCWYVMPTNSYHNCFCRKSSCWLIWAQLDSHIKHRLTSSSYAITWYKEWSICPLSQSRKNAFPSFEKSETATCSGATLNSNRAADPEQQQRRTWKLHRTGATEDNLLSVQVRRVRQDSLSLNTVTYVLTLQETSTGSHARFALLRIMKWHLHSHHIAYEYSYIH